MTGMPNLTVILVEILVNEAANGVAGGAALEYMEKNGYTKRALKS